MRYKSRDSENRNASVQWEAGRKDRVSLFHHGDTKDTEISRRGHLITVNLRVLRASVVNPSAAKKLRDHESSRILLRIGFIILDSDS
jgi:hypothetical protein